MIRDLDKKVYTYDYTKSTTWINGQANSWQVAQDRTSFDILF